MKAFFKNCFVALGFPLLAGVCAAEAAEAVAPASAFGFFASKMKNGETLRVAYIGGSITQGSGASKYGNNYFWLSKSELEKTAAAKGAKLQVFTAAVGGTGSAFGAFRIGAQLLNRKPDLLIVEFAVNDGSAKDAAESMEGIARQALKCNPQMAVAFFYTSCAGYEDKYYSKGLLPPAVEAHAKVAERYGFLQINAGPLVDKGIKDGLFSVKDFFPDGTHPSDLGHAFYAKTLIDGILPALDLPAPAKNEDLPAPLFEGNRYELAQLAPIVPLEASENWKSSKTQWNWYGVEIFICEKPESKISFKIEGSEPQLIFLGSLLATWKEKGVERSAKINGRFGLPYPASWRLPPDAALDNGVLSVEALPDDKGKVRGELWGVFSLRNP